MGDTIHIEALELVAFIGVPEEERASPQRLTASITMECLTPFDSLKDDISRTADYFEASRAMQALALEHPRKLIETLAAEMCAALLQRFPLVAVEVEVRKYILPYAGHTAVKMRRER